MKLFPADHETRYQVPGVPGSVRKPVNLGQGDTAFTRLRSLRLYQFQAGTVINGHAEEDEVFVIVTTGAVEIKIGFHDDAVDGFGTFTLSAPGAQSGMQATAAAADAFAAYLPPHSVYRMKPLTDADVAYARAASAEERSPAIFAAQNDTSSDGLSVLLNEVSHAQHLRLIVARVNAREGGTDFMLGSNAKGNIETLLHVRGRHAERLGTLTAGARSLTLCSWDTVALAPGDEGAVLHVPQGAHALAIAVSAV